MNASEAKGAQRNWGLIILLLYLLVEYGRPQELLPGLKIIRPGFILIGALGAALVVTRSVRFDNVQSKLMLGFLILTLIHTFTAANNFYAYQGARAFFMYVIIFLSILKFVDSLQSLTRFINIWIAINLFCAVWGIAHGGKVPNSAFMGDENDFALVMVMAVPFSFFMFLEASALTKKIYYLASTGVFIAAVAASLSRGGFVGLVVVGLYCLYKTPRRALSASIVAVMILVLFLAAPASYWDEMKSIRSENIEAGTGGERWYYFKVGLRVFRDNPVIGVGPGNYPVIAHSYQTTEELSTKKSIWFRSAHSIYTTLVSELGSVGIILFSGMLYLSRKNLRKIINADRQARKNSAALPGAEGAAHPKRIRTLSFVAFAVNGAIIGYLVSGAFLSVLGYPHLWIMFAISTAATNLLWHCVRMGKEPQGDSNHILLP